jgi:hypothetical protein
MPHRLFTPAALIPAALLVACAGDPGMSAHDVARTAAADLTETLTALEHTYAAVQAAEGDATQRSAAPTTCVDVTGTCSWCTDWEGRLTQGDFVTAPAALPCDAESADARSMEVEDGWLQGSWSRPLDNWVVVAQGERAAVVDTEEGPRAVSWLVDDLAVSLDDAGALSSWDVTMVVRGSDAQRWTVQVGGVGTAFVGTLSANTGEACTWYGTFHTSPEVFCDERR